MLHLHHVHKKHQSFHGAKKSCLSVFPSISSYSFIRQRWAVVTCHPDWGQTSHTQSQAVRVLETVNLNQQILLTAYQKKEKKNKSPFSQKNLFLNGFWSFSLAETCTALAIFSFIPRYCGSALAGGFAWPEQELNFNFKYCSPCSWDFPFGKHFSFRNFKFPILGGLGEHKDP